MSERHVRLQLDVTIDGSSISGEVSGGECPDRRFTGRLGLLAAIENALEVPDEAER
jgi:hypothetical protein